LAARPLYDGSLGQISECVMSIGSQSPVVGQDLIEALSVPYRATAAYNGLLRLGHEALPAVQAGLRHGSADVRFHCCRFLDRYLAPAILADLIGMLNDGDQRVRVTALHTLACDRCKEGSCRPEESQVLPPAMNLLASDPSAHVRAMAIEVVGQYVHTNPSAEEAIEAAARSDGSSAVRKKAGWYAPGGTIYRRSAPKARKRPSM
jgi:HEAT repeat protein